MRDVLIQALDGIASVLDVIGPFGGLSALRGRIEAAQFTLVAGPL